MNMAVSHFAKSLRLFLALATASGGLIAISPQIASAAGPSTTQVAMGSSHVVAASTNGTVWTWGSLIPGPSGTGSRFSFQSPVQVPIPGARSVVDVAATSQSSVVLATDGTVWAWGYQGLGLGDANQTASSDYLNPLQVSFANTQIAEISGGCEGYIAVDVNGEVWQWGSFWGVWSLSVSRPVKVAGIANAVSVARSCSSAYAVLSDGTVRAWGSNGGGRLGDGTTTDRSTPVAVSLPSGKSVSAMSVSDTHVLALATDGTLWGWGSNSQSQLAADPSGVTFSSTPRRVSVPGASGNIVSISTSQSTPSSMAVMSSGEVWDWGTWSTTDYAPKKRNLPTADLAGTRLVSGAMTSYTNSNVFVGDDGSLWSRTSWNGSVSVDGNCGADSSDYTQWINGQNVAPRYLVRTISNGQFGATFNEDRIGARGVATSAGVNLPLDGSGTVVGRQGNSISIVLTGPLSTCYASSSLVVSFDLNGDGVFETTGVSGVDDVGLTTSTGTYVLDWSGRRKGAVKITNWDGISKTYLFWMGVAVVAGSGGGGGAGSALPVVAGSKGTSIAIGTDGRLYGWGKTSAVIGAASDIPKRLFPSSTDTFSKVGFFRVSNNSGTSVAAALTTNGQVKTWGLLATNGFFFNSSGTRINFSSDLSQISLPSGVARWIDLSLTTCGGRPVLQLVGDDNQLYIHGINGPECTSSIGSTPITPSWAVGIPVTQILNGLLKSTSEWISYSLRKIYSYSNGRSEIVESQPYAYSPTSVSPITGMFQNEYRGDTACDYWPATDGLEINGSGQVDLVKRKFIGGSCGLNPATRGVLTVVSRNNISNWTGKTALSFKVNNNSLITILASDGSVWDYYRWSTSPLTRRIADARMPFIKRLTGSYLVGSDGSIWSSNFQYPWDEGQNAGRIGSTLGNCGTNWSNDELAATRVFSSGQFGSAFTEDRFSFQVDTADSFDNSQWDKSSYPGRSNDWGANGFPVLTLRPTAGTQLYGYVHSSCLGDQITSATWDMDDDGVYETSASMTSVDAAATKMTTDMRDKFEAITYAGIGVGWKQIRTPSLDFSIAGGKYIGLKLVSAYGSQTKRFAVRVQPQKPTGYTGVSINAGARFTDSADVNLNLVWPEGATTALLSNDGGFADAQLIPLTKTIKWKLPANGSGLLSSVVYVRFLSLQPDQKTGSWNNDELSYQVADDIILDLSAPAVSSVNASMSEASSFSAIFTEAMAVKKVVTAASSQFAVVSIQATDAASGIAGMQVASDPAMPGPIRPYSAQIRIPVDRERVAVRVVDNVGLWSEWKYARLTGFVPLPEAPAQVPAVPAPAAPVTPEPE